MNAAATVSSTSAQSAHSARPSAAPRPGRESRPGGITHTGRLRHGYLEPGHRTLAIFIHVSPFFWILGLGPLALLGPFVLWLVGRERSVFVDDHGREAINFMLSVFILSFVLAVTIIGLFLIPVLLVVAVVNMIRAAVAAGQDEYFRYPVTFRFL